jgi:ribosomal protein S18 acetylase RimI-like enzyme
MEFAIRETSDLEVLERVLQIIHAAFALHDGRIDPPSGAQRESLESLAARFPSETLLVADADGIIVGCIWCRQDGDDVYIGRLAVDPEQQGRGIARRLLAASIEWARSHGAKSMSLGVRVELVENIAFFERHGFQIVRAESHAGFDRPTNYHMEKTLTG